MNTWHIIELLYVYVNHILCCVRDVADGLGDKTVQDATAATDADSGLQMAMSPCSALSACSETSASLKHPQYSGSLAVTTTGVNGHSGICHFRLN